MVTRYIIVDADKDDLYLRAHPEGPLVRYADYETLQRAYDRLKDTALAAVRNWQNVLDEFETRIDEDDENDTEWIEHQREKIRHALAEAGIQGDTT